VTNRDLRLVEFGPGERYRVLRAVTSIDSVRSPEDVLREINQKVGPAVRSVQRRRRRRVLAHKHGRILGFGLFAAELVGQRLAALARKWSER
jgi:hypothetical protein